MRHPVSRRALLGSAGSLAAAGFLPEALLAAEKPAAAPPATLDFRPMHLKLAHTWTIARGSSDEKKNGVLSVTAEGVTGCGEAAANKRWGQSWETAEAAFRRVKAAVAGTSPWEHLLLLERAEAEAGPDAEVVAALDTALWDWKGRRLGAPVHRLLGIPSGRMPVTSFSIGIDTPEAMKQKTREAAAYPLLKVKVGLAEDEVNLAAVRSVTTKPIRVDANEGWKGGEEAARKLAWLKGQGVELVEQPLPVDRNADMAKLRPKAGIPLVADESVLHPRDVPPLAGLFDGINVKLAKCGGITRALELVAVARALGLKTMLGCMIESSLGIAAGVAIAPLFDWVDLDGNLLLAADPWKGLRIEAGRWRLPEGPGLGVARA